MPHAPAEPTAVNFTSNVTGGTYTLNTNKMVSRDAQAYCNLQGGHVAAYSSYDEQAEVEAYFTNQVGRCTEEATPPAWSHGGMAACPLCGAVG